MFTKHRKASSKYFFIRRNKQIPSLIPTPQFLSDYGSMYKIKAAEIVTKASRVEIGLEKLKAGAKDVEKMKIVLAEEEVRE